VFLTIKTLFVMCVHFSFEIYLCVSVEFKLNFNHSDVSFPGVHLLKMEILAFKDR